MVARMWEKGTLVHYAGGVNPYSHCGKQDGGSPQKLKIELPIYDPIIPLPGIYSKKMKMLFHFNYKSNTICYKRNLKHFGTI